MSRAGIGYCVSYDVVHRRKFECLNETIGFWTQQVCSFQTQFVGVTHVTFFCNARNAGIPQSTTRQCF